MLIAQSLWRKFGNQKPNVSVWICLSANNHVISLWTWTTGAEQAAYKRHCCRYRVGHAVVVTRVELAVGRAAGTTNRGKEWNCCRLLRHTGSLEGYGVCVWNADAWRWVQIGATETWSKLEKGGIFQLLENVSTNSKFSCDRTKMADVLAFLLPSGPHNSVSCNGCNQILHLRRWY